MTRYDRYNEIQNFMELFSMQAATAQLLQRVEQLPSQELDKFVTQVLQVCAHRQAPKLTELGIRFIFNRQLRLFKSIS